TALESALKEASAAPIVDENFEKELAAFQANAKGKQARIETPWMTPVVEIPAPAPVSSPSTVEVSPEAAFFAEAAVEETPVEAPVAKRRVWPFVLGAALIAVVALFIDAQRAPTAAPQPVVVEAAPAPVVKVVAPADLPDVEPPEFIDVESVHEAEAAPVVDVSENLAEATKLYNAGQYKKAISVLEQVVTDDPSSVLAWNLMGLAKYDSLDSKGAHAAAAKVLEIEPSNARVQILLATLHFDANEKTEGRSALQKYLELEPNGPEVGEVQALLKQYK
ncbi:MAG TPA: tetratricopeptide repeat protein, partial [Archangium sp.]